jgi:tRNA threonylcarbamoyladenosine biosynthesis protein TsaB
MRILAADTSSERGSVCITDNDMVLGEIRLASSVQHAERLFRSVEFLLASLPITLGDIDLFVASRGPGSFTGLRVGLAAMEGFASAHGQRGAGISTLEALAWKTGIENELVASVIDARRGEIYGGLYRRVSNQLVEERPPVVLKPELWFASLPDSRVHFCGDGALKYRSFVNRPGWLFYDMDLYLAVAMAHMASTVHCGPLEPLYVRRTDAETALEARHDSVAGPSPKSQKV